jgi:hypothetical protein
MNNYTALLALNNTEDALSSRAITAFITHISHENNDHARLGKHFL